MTEDKEYRQSIFRRVCDVLDRSIHIAEYQIQLKSIMMGLLIFIGFMTILALVQFSTPNLPGNDGYYHIKMAFLMRTEGLKPEFTWLPLTLLNAREFYNHHFLFHILLIPFTFGNLVTGAKWAAVIFASLSFFLVWLLLKSQRVPHAALWSLSLLAVSEAFIYRMSLPRTQSLSLGFLIISLILMFKGHHKLLLVLGFLYVWLYNAFPLLLVVAAAYVVGVWLTERRFSYQPVVYSGLGILAGLIINPYFPYNLVFIAQHILPKLLDATAVSVGSEWYPYTTGQLLENSLLALGIFISAVFALGMAGSIMKKHTAISFILAVVFGLMLFQSRRFIEYFPPFTVLFAAFAWSPIFSATAETAERDAPDKHKSWKRKLIQHLAPAIMLLVLLPMSYFTLRGARKSVRASKPYLLFAEASRWLIANTDPGERVFQTDWDDFPRLFFYNTHNTYIVGLDPTYFQLHDADLYTLWVEVTRGNVENPSQIISEYFDAEYVLSDLLHADFITEAESDPYMIETYRDGESVIFHIVAP